MPKSSAVYVGVDNQEELEVVFTKATRTKIRKLAKRAKMNEAELLAKYLGNVDIAALAGIAAAHRARK